MESIYETALVYELQLRGLEVAQQVAISTAYKDIDIGGQRVDLLVQPGLVVELKAVDTLLPIHEAQLLSYLKAGRFRLGLLINFHVEQLKQGIRRMVY